MNTYTLQLTEKQLIAVGNALGVRPYVEVVEVLNSINAQVQSQQQTAHNKAADARDLPNGSNPP